jgi:hypothetical protein
MYKIGAKVSRLTISASCLKPVTIVGSTKLPGRFIFFNTKRKILKIKQLDFFF